MPIEPEYQVHVASVHSECCIDTKWMNHIQTMTDMFSCRNSPCSWRSPRDVLASDNFRAMHITILHVLLLFSAVTELNLYKEQLLFRRQCKSTELKLSPSVLRNSIPCHCMQGRIRGREGAKANATVALGFKCTNCNGEFASRRAMDCHRRHTASVGTPCADPGSYKSLSFTGRADMSTGILRQHDAATLGERIILQRRHFKHNRIILI